MDKVYLTQNVALLQINVKQGVDEYYLAKNVDWQRRKIDRIVLYVPQAAGLLSPIDRQAILDRSAIDNLYLDLYGIDEHTICNGMSYTDILYTNNHPFKIDQELQFNLSRLYFTQTPVTSGALLMYIFYEGATQYDYEMPARSITIEFPMAADERITFTQLINTYLHAPGENVKGIAFWHTDTNQAFVTLRDHQNTYVIDRLATELCRPLMVGTDAEATQIHPMLLNDIDIDFDYSNILNGTAGAITVTMTIYY